MAALREHAPSIARLIGPQADLVEFGAGSPVKARIVLDALSSPARYIPVDLSVEHLDGAKQDLERAYPGIVVERCRRISRDAGAAGAAPRRRPTRRSVSGLDDRNLSPEQARCFLADAAERLAGGGLLVGVDLVKDPGLLHRAYNDALGVTAAFNATCWCAPTASSVPILIRPRFDHYALYRPERSASKCTWSASGGRPCTCAGPRSSLTRAKACTPRTLTSTRSRAFAIWLGGRVFAPGPVWCDRQRLFSVHWLAAPQVHGSALAGR